MSKITDKNYIVIQSFMVTELKLKGNELLVYAIIFGFSQTEGQKFSGSLRYLAEWTNSTIQGVSKNLKSLAQKGYIEKEENNINGVKYCLYRATKFNTDKQSLNPLNKVEGGIKQSLTGVLNKVEGGIKQSLNNNIDYNIVDNIVDNNNVASDNAEKYDKETITEIIDYLNEKAHKSYKPNSKATMRHINARLNEGYTLSEFKQVIDNRCAAWLGTEKMEQYLRPETLFGSKFESYLNAPAPKRRGSDGRVLSEKSNGWEIAFGGDENV